LIIESLKNENKFLREKVAELTTKYADLEKCINEKEANLEAALESLEMYKKVESTFEYEKNLVHDLKVELENKY